MSDEICNSCGEVNEYWNGDNSDELCLDCSLIKADHLYELQREMRWED